MATTYIHNTAPASTRLQIDYYAESGGQPTVLPTDYKPGPPPAGRQIVGNSYDVRLSSANLLTKAAIVELYYHPEVMRAELEIDLVRQSPIQI